MSLFVHTFYRQRAPLVDDGRGGKKRDWGNISVAALPGWVVDAGITFDDKRNREGAMVAFTARGPMNADVEATDRIIYEGKTYVIEGAVERQPGPTPRTSHCIILLKRWEG